MRTAQFFFFLLSFLIRSTTSSREMCVCVCVCVLLFLGRAVKYGASDRVERTKKKKDKEKRGKAKKKKRAQLTT